MTLRTMHWLRNSGVFASHWNLLPLAVMTYLGIYYWWLKHLAEVLTNIFVIKLTKKTPMFFLWSPFSLTHCSERRQSVKLLLQQGLSCFFIDLFQLLIACGEVTQDEGSVPIHNSLQKSIMDECVLLLMYGEKWEGGGDSRWVTEVGSEKADQQPE